MPDEIYKTSIRIPLQMKNKLFTHLSSEHRKINGTVLLALEKYLGDLKNAK